jgi:membrane protein YdbS with pleckstrin-like domain
LEVFHVAEILPQIALQIGCILGAFLLAGLIIGIGYFIFHECPWWVGAGLVALYVLFMSGWLLKSMFIDPPDYSREDKGVYESYGHY